MIRLFLVTLLLFVALLALDGLYALPAMRDSQLHSPTLQVTNPRLTTLNLAAPTIEGCLPDEVCTPGEPNPTVDSETLAAQGWHLVNVESLAAALHWPCPTEVGRIEAEAVAAERARIKTAVEGLPGQGVASSTGSHIDPDWLHRAAVLWVVDGAK
jgi:hypothetical protein